MSTTSARTWSTSSCPTTDTRSSISASSSPATSIIKSAQEHQADAIGLSGLLVKSTLEMKYVIQDLERQKLDFPVICGGAALTRKYVEDDLRREYSNAVFYADDAFAGLHIMEDLASANGATQKRASTKAAP